MFKGIRLAPFTFNCAYGLVKGRFVTLTRATNTVVYTVAEAAPTHITVADEENLLIACLDVNDVSTSTLVEAATGGITAGDELEVATGGKVDTADSGVSVGFATEAATAAGQLIERLA